MWQGVHSGWRKEKWRSGRFIDQRPPHEWYAGAPCAEARANASTHAGVSNAHYRWHRIRWPVVMSQTAVHVTYPTPSNAPPQAGAQIPDDPLIRVCRGGDRRAADAAQGERDRSQDDQGAEDDRRRDDRLRAVQASTGQRADPRMCGGGPGRNDRAPGGPPAQREHRVSRPGVTLSLSGTGAPAPERPCADAVRRIRRRISAAGATGLSGAVRP